MYEHHRTRPIPMRMFTRRLAGHFAIAFFLVVFSIAGGMWGYEHYESLGWRAAFENSAMLLGGMGPVDIPRTDGGKLFAGFYALYCGLVFLVIAGILMAPVIHRILHLLHWKEDETK